MNDCQPPVSDKLGEKGSKTRCSTGGSTEVFNQTELNSQVFNFEFGLNGFDVSNKWVKGGCKMKFNDMVKIGFWGLVGYYLLKEFSQPTNDANYNEPSQTPGFNWNSSPNVPDPQPHYAPPT